MSIFTQQIKSILSIAKSNCVKEVGKINNGLVAGNQRSIEMGEATKQRIIDALIEVGKPLSKSEIAPLVGVSRETCRSWCARMVEEGVLIRTGEHKTTRYEIANIEDEEK